MVAATPLKTTAVSLPMSQYVDLGVEEQIEDLPEDEGMDDLDLGLEEALQGTFTTSQSVTATDEKVDEGTEMFTDFWAMLILHLCSSNW